MQSGVSRVVIGIRHPLSHLRGIAIKSLRGAGLTVDVLGESGSSAEPERLQECLNACLWVNEVCRPLLFLACHVKAATRLNTDISSAAEDPDTW